MCRHCRQHHIKRKNHLPSEWRLENEGMVLPIEQRDVAIELSKPVTVTMTNLLNLTHVTDQPVTRSYSSAYPRVIRPSSGNALNIGCNADHLWCVSADGGDAPTDFASPQNRQRLVIRSPIS